MMENCTVCGSATVWPDRMFWCDGHQNYYLCSTCAVLYGRCVCCDRPIMKNRLTQVQGKSVCPDCLGEETFVCEECGERFFIIEREYVTPELCHHCAVAYDRCAACGTIDRYERFTIYDGEPYCAECAKKQVDVPLHPYEFKPLPIFHGEGHVFFGVELELSHPDGPALQHNVGLWLGFDEESFYLKKDSSLTCGFEAVSHPRSLDSWHKLLPKLRELFAQTTDVIAGRDGLHVHISRGDMTPAHMVRFGAFFAAEQDRVVKIARRESCEWARYHRKPQNGAEALDCARNDSRYEAVNWSNEATVEIRVFRSTLDIVEFYAAIEFCHAAYTFTKAHVTIQQIVKGEAWALFEEFFRADPAQYGNLIKFWEEA